jgi:NitT/TauT family transport system substrate-binding protein
MVSAPPAVSMSARRDSSRSHAIRLYAAWLLAVLLGAAALVAAGCGGEDGEEGEPTADNPVELRIGETAGIPFAFLRFGVDKGFYRDAGLVVEPVPVQGAAPIISGVVSGDFAMGGSDTATFAQGIARDLPLAMITPGTSVTSRSEQDFSAVQVSPRSGIGSPGDLRGKTIGVNVLGNISEVSISGALEKLGVDPKSVEYTEVPFPDMVAAVQRERVDAALTIEPFRTIGQAAGLKTLFGPFTTFERGLQIGSIVTTESYAEGNPEVISSFQKAHARTARYVREHEQEFRRTLPKVAQLDPALADKVNLPVWEERVDPASVEQVADAMTNQGLVQEEPDVQGAIHDGA